MSTTNGAAERDHSRQRIIAAEESLRELLSRLRAARALMCQADALALEPHDLTSTFTLLIEDAFGFALDLRARLVPEQRLSVDDEAHRQATLLRDRAFAGAREAVAKQRVRRFRDEGERAAGGSTR